MAESPEAVALALLEMVAVAENKDLRSTSRSNVPSKDWLLTTYAECLRTVRKGKTDKEREKDHEKDKLQIPAKEKEWVRGLPPPLERV
jgi:hypothetical protein